MTYRYAIDVFYDEIHRWVTLPGLGDVSLQYAEGYVTGHHDSPGLARAIRIVRSDGKVKREEPACAEVSLGMIAGWPSAQQYRRAAAAAIAKAEQLDEHAQRCAEIDGQRR